MKDKIQVIVKHVFDVKDITGRSRIHPVIFARQAYCYLMRRYTGLSYELIGREINRTHATVLHACNQIEILRNDPVIKDKLDRCISLIEQVNGYKEGHWYWFKELGETYTPAEFCGYYNEHGGIYRWSFFGLDTVIPYNKDNFQTDGEIIHPC